MEIKPSHLWCDQEHTIRYEKIKYSDCCGAVYDDDIARCAECYEPCGYYEE